MAAPTAAAARGGAAAVAPLTSCVPQVDAPCLTCSGQAVLRRRAQAHHGLHFTTTTSRACLSSTKSTSRRPPRRPPGGFRPDREFRGRRQPNRETLHNMPIIRQEGKPSHLNQPGRHAHGCISGRQKQQRGYMLYAQDVTARRRLKPRVCRPRSRSCATPAQIRPPRSAHAPVPRYSLRATSLTLLALAPPYYISILRQHHIISALLPRPRLLRRCVSKKPYIPL